MGASPHPSAAKGANRDVRWAWGGVLLRRGYVGVISEIDVTEFTDPGCPWAYSASPALAVLHWRYGEQLRWRIVTIGLTESAAALRRRAATRPTRMPLGMLDFRRYGMPFAPAPRARVAATARACRAIVATRLLDPPRERDVLRALQFAWFTTTLLLDEDDDIARALARVDGLDVDAVVAAIDDARRRSRPTSRTSARRARPRAGPRTSRARRARPTDRCATRRPRWSSRARDGAAHWRPAASSRSRPMTC